MALSASIIHNYDHPNFTVVRCESRHDLGGAATTAYGKHRFWHKAIGLAVYFYANIADASGSAWQAYYRPVATPDGSADVALGSAWAVGTSAAGTTNTIVLSGLTDSGVLTVDAAGRPIFNPGDAIYVKTNGSNGASGRIDVGYEYHIATDAVHN
jgi:hypothetical protein